MFRQKQTPRGNNPPKNMLHKCEAKTTAEHPHGRVIPTELHMQLYWNHIPAPAVPPPNRLHTHKTLSQKNISGGLPPYWYLILKLNFVKRNLSKVKNSWDHWSCDYLTAVVVENVCIHKLTKFPSKRKYE